MIAPGFVGDGLIVVDKPAGWTSHDVVAKMRGICGTRRVGHLGTLDPIATGVLPVMVGQVTRLARFWERADKTYEGTVRFGFATTTYDRAGERVGETVEPVIAAEQIEEILATMRGEIEQTPPPVSAKKIGGVPAYKLARQNVAVEIPAVTVTIHELKLLDYTAPLARLLVRCTAGTYVRTIAHELGRQLGCGAHIVELIRTAAGPFELAGAHTLETLQQWKDEGRLADALLPASTLLPQFPAVPVDDLTATQIRQGRSFRTSPFRVRMGSEYVRALAPDGRLLAIGRAVLPHTYHPMLVFNGAEGE